MLYSNKMLIRFLTSGLKAEPAKPVCCPIEPSEGLGFPQGVFVTETWMTAMAARCHLPPEKVTDRN